MAGVGLDAIADALTQPQLAGPLRDLVCHALRTPWCWPLDSGVAELARRLAAPPKHQCELGKTCLVSVRGDEAALWELCDGAPRTDLTTFVRDAQAAAEQAPRVAFAHLKIVRSVEPLLPERAPSWGARALWREGGDLDLASVDGASFGLSMCLAAASLLLGQPVPADLCASVQVHSDGRLDRVDGLRAKLRIVDRSALGVRRFLVHEEQLDHARCLRDELHLRLDMVGVTTLADAIDFAFPDQGPARLWPTPGSASDTVTLLFRELLKGRTTPFPRWDVIRRTMSAVADRLRADSLDRERAAIVEKIAHRHAGGGDSSILIDPAAALVASLSEGQRTLLAAQMVQAARDCASPDLGRRLDEAWTNVATSAPDPEDLVALGALGRALAHEGRFPAAITALEAAIEGWFREGREAEASFPLCELVRLHGVDRDRRHFEAALTRFVAPFRASRRPDPVSRCYVALEVGRAALLLERTDLAHEELDGADWSAGVHPALACSRERWHARVHAARREREAAAEARSRVVALAGADPELAIYPLLVQLDVALEEGNGVAAIVDKLLSSPSRNEVAHLVTGPPADRDQARRVADQYAY